MKALILSCVLMCISISGFSQNFKISFNSGANLSCLQDTESKSGKWQHKAGAAAGLSAEYALSNSFSVLSAMSFTSVYYSRQNYFNYDEPIHVYDEINEPYWPVFPNDFFYQYDILRLPLSFKLSSATQPRVFVAVGPYYAKAFRRNNALNNEPANFNDFGFSLSHGAEYRLNKNFSFSLELHYSEAFTKHDEMPGRNGSVEFLSGLSYTFDNNTESSESYEMKEQKEKIAFGYRSGIIYSALGGENSEHYKPGIGFSGGPDLKMNLSGNLYFETALLFQRKSYALTDSSSQYHVYRLDDPDYFVNTRTDLDYLSFPFMLSAHGSNPFHFYAGVGFYAALCTDARTTGYAYHRIESEYSITDYKRHVYDTMHYFFKKGDFGFAAQAGFEFPLTDVFRLKLNTAFEHSFIKPAKQTEPDFDFRMWSLAFNAGIVIPLR